MENFNELGLPKDVLSSLEKMGIKVPTEIQKRTIPVISEGSDLLASSKTGSGKTFAYLLPIISSIHKTGKKSLVLVPTRELATQVGDNFFKLASRLRMGHAILIGGDSMGRQLFSLKSSPKLIIGTPGRIIDHLLRKSLVLEDTNLAVLDEMDRMLDMGMRDQLEEINKFLPAKRQTLMFSATMPDRIIDVSAKYLFEPIRISVDSTTEATPQVKQEKIEISNELKFEELTKRLDQTEGSVIIFVKTKIGADKLAKNLRFKNYGAESIHGDLRQSKRDRIISSFRKSKFRIIVATDVMARGIDVPSVRQVINYDLPSSPEDYLHRVGRTGRAGLEGHALSFVSKEDSSKWRAIDRMIKYGETSDPEEFQRKKSGKKRSFFSKRKRPEFGKRKDFDFKNSRPEGKSFFKTARAK